MSLYRRGKVWWMDFHFHGQRIQETTGMTSITRAREVQEKRKQALRDGTAGIRKQQQPRLLSVAAPEWQEAKKPAWALRMADIARNSMGHLLPVLGKQLLADIEASDISKYQKARLDEGASNRTVNIEVGVLRQIMRKDGTWARIQPDVNMLLERENVGQALSEEEVPLPIIAKIVGWAPGTMAKMAARYGHFGIEELRGAVEAISSKIADVGVFRPGSLQFSLHSEANPGSQRAN